MTWSAHVHEHRCGTHEGRRDRNPQLDVQVAQVGKWASQGVQGAKEPRLRSPKSMSLSLPTPERSSMCAAWLPTPCNRGTGVGHR